MECSAARRLPLLVLLGLGLGGAGCSARVQHGLDERQANEIQTVLVERGFRARKSGGGPASDLGAEVESADAADGCECRRAGAAPGCAWAGVRSC
jgi:type III secretion protein J